MTVSTTTSTVYLEVDGRPVPARECVWIDTAPCGCLSGVMVAASGSEVYINAEQAAAAYYSNSVARRRAESEGFVLSLTTHAAFAANPWGDCEHDPKWGVAHIDPPEGWEWGTADGSYGRQTHIKHMVPAGNALAPNNWNWREYPQPLPAICGASRRGSHWRAVDWTVDVEPCLKCEAKAGELVQP